MDPTIVSIPVIVGIGGLAAAFTEFVKRTVVDPHIYAPTAPAHDTFVRGVCFVIALLLTVLSIVPTFPGTGIGWLTLLFQAATSAGISISGYHVITGSASPTPLAGTLVSSEAIAPSPTDLAAAVVTALQPALARLVPPAYNFPASILPQPATPPVTAQVTTSDGVGVKTDTVIIPASLGNLVLAPSPTVTAGEVSPKPA